MNPETDKVICPDCGAHLRDADLLTAPHPFTVEAKIAGCPFCHSCSGFDRACDEPGCWEITCCGFKTGDQPYRMTCSKHYRALVA